MSDHGEPPGSSEDPYHEWVRANDAEDKLEKFRLDVSEVALLTKDKWAQNKLSDLLAALPTPVDQQKEQDDEIGR